MKGWSVCVSCENLGTVEAIIVIFIEIVFAFFGEFIR